MEFPNILVPAIPGFVLLIAVEWAYGFHHQKHLYHWKDAGTSIALGLGNLVVGIATKGAILALFLWLYQFRLFTLPATAWWAWLLCFLADDFSYYWMHRASHEIRWWWASHAVHHSSEHYNLAAALRQTWTGNLTGTFLFWAWMPLMGFHPGMVLLMQSASLLYQFWIHTQAVHKLPRPLEWVLNTPSHHRVHHGSDVHYLDRNHGGVLIVWDRLFGTFVPEADKPTYGLTQNVHTFHPVRVAFHEWERLWADWRRTPGLHNKGRLLLMPPGWSADGRGKTARAMRNLKQNNSPIKENS